MGIFCELSLFKPPDGAYHPGQEVSGKIKYAVDEPMEFDRITTSLKGNGSVLIKVRQGNNRRHNYRSREVYVDRDLIIQDTKIEVPVGCYEVNFNFTLPNDLPSSLKINTFRGRYRITCRIMYYSLCPCSSSNIDIQANILNSVIPFGGKIILNYEVVNNSNVLVKSVETKLVEIYKFKATGRSAVKIVKDVPDTDSKSTSISCGATQNMPVEIKVLSDIFTLDNAKIVSRDYYVRIIVQLPCPHINAEIDIPVQIGAIDASIAGPAFVQPAGGDLANIDPPPSYWEAMGETKKEDDDVTDDDDDDDHKGK